MREFSLDQRMTTTLEILCLALHHEQPEPGHPDIVEELRQQLEDKATIVYRLEEFPYGMREFAIRDNNGYILQFGQEI